MILPLPWNYPKPQIIVLSRKISDLPSLAGFFEGEVFEGSNFTIGHLRLVAGTFNTLDIAGVIDDAIRKMRQHYLTHGQTRQDNGCSTASSSWSADSISIPSSSRLSPSTGSWEQGSLPTISTTMSWVERSMRSPLMIRPNSFNKIAVDCLLASDYGTHCLHVDTTTFSVTGDYESILILVT